MLKKVQGIILRTVKYSETSIICDIYTLSLGLRTYIISGVRKKNAKISPALVRPMSLVEMIVYYKEDKDINRIKEIKPQYIYQNVLFDVAKGAVGLFITEVAQKSIKEVTENPILYYFLQESYQLLDKTSVSVSNFSAWFLVHFSAQLGIAPRLENLKKTAIFDYKEGQVLDQKPTHIYYFSVEDTHLMAAFQQLDFEAAAQVVLSIKDKRAFVRNMLDYYRYHIANFGQLNSLIVLQEVFA